MLMQHRFYKLVHIQYGKEISFDFISERFKDRKITFCFTKKKIGDDEFEIPEGYNVMSMSDFENMFGGY